ncbi:MAG TPA: hypothetical protein VFQ89_03580 [Candidatus Binatia bacterium]|nr:hypothetical protein [Candidatus Binatia bacterium]
MAKLFLATLCDDVREEKTGKFSLMGLFDRFIVADFRAPLPTFWLFVQIGCDSEGEHEMTVEFRQIDGPSVLRADLKHGIAGKSSITGLCHAKVNLRLEQSSCRAPAFMNSLCAATGRSRHIARRGDTKPGPCRKLG